MAYKKSMNWYISRELRGVAKKLEKWINRRGTPKVNVQVSRDKLLINAPFYAKFQDKGVKGVKSKKNKSLAGYKYKPGGDLKDIPSPKHFERYGKKKMFAISRIIYNQGIPAKKYIGKGIGHFAPQVSRAIKRGGRLYIKNEIMPESGVHKIKI